MSLTRAIAPFLIAGMVLVLPALVAAQEPAADARVHLGPLGLTPTLAISSIGIDANVYNEAGEAKRDFTSTFTPKVDIWLRVGRAQLSGSTLWNVRYYRQYSDQRGVSASNDIRLDWTSSRLSPYVAGSFRRTYEREGFEIDIRAHRLEYRARAGTMARVSGKFSLQFAAEQTGQAFDRSDFSRDLSLRDQLNRIGRRFESGVRYEATPLTAITVTADQQFTRFEFSPERNSTGLRLLSGVELKPLALISGSARVGILRFSPADPKQPGFTGPVASLDLGYTLLGTTRFSLRIDRDLEYSIDDLKTYYLRFGVGGGVSKQLDEHWDVGITAGTQRLGSRSITPAVAAQPRDRGTLGAETVRQYAATAGYRFTRGFRLGLNADFTRRSGVPLEQYESLRIFGNAVYGIH